MNSPDENIDPHSLPNLSHLLSHSAQKRNKRIVHNGSSLASGLKESILSNISPELGHVDTQLPTPPSSQSMDSAHDKLIDDTRLPISPPPEEEIRDKEISAHTQTQKQKNHSRLPVPSRGAASSAFKFPAAPQSFAQYQQQVHQPSSGGLVSTTLPDNVPPASSSNPRKRPRSAIPPFAVPALAPSISSSSKSASEPTPTTTVTQSPNPKPRKQPKVHESGVYTGSGFKRRHTRGTSAESLNEDGVSMPPPSTLKSPARKKRTNDPGVEDYTPQRERASASVKHNRSPVKQKPRPRRSATPDVPYEPPAEQFTPPRHVVLQLPSSTASTRFRKGRQSSTQPKPAVEVKVVRVKPERLTSPFPLPPVDFSKPTAPPSPTDDPILLVGPPVLPRGSKQVQKALVDAAVGEDDISGLAGHQAEPRTPIRASSLHDADESRWQMGPNAFEQTALIDVAFDGPSQFDATFDLASDSDSDDAAPAGSAALSAQSRTLDANTSTGSHIFHSDDDEGEAGEDEGEYTGRFKFYSVPVKQDPPSSATRARRDSWGRPISPFPFRRRTSGSGGDVDNDGPQNLSDGESPPQSPSDGRRRSGTPKHISRSASPTGGSYAQNRRTGGFTLSEMEARLEARNAGHHEMAAEGEEEPKEQVEEAVSGLDLGDMTEEVERGDVTVHVEDRHTYQGVETDGDKEDVETVEREVTPIDENVDLGGTHDEPELSEDEDHHQSNVSSNEEDQSQDELNGNDIAQEDEEDEGEHSAPRAVSPTHLSSASRVIRSPSSRPTTQFTEHYIALRTDGDEDESILVNAYDSEDGSSDEEVIPPGVVEISSDDPKAAARAAAILKLHHSYILDGLVAHRARRSSPRAFPRRQSFAFGDGDIQAAPNHQDLIRRARRKSIAYSGGVLQHRPRQTSHSPLARSIYVPPGSPAHSVVSAEDALLEAETEIRAVSASPRGPRTPLTSRSFEVEISQDRLIYPSPSVAEPGAASEPSGSSTDQREWTKSDWKRLDICFTDERIALASAMKLDTQMAEVDDVEINAVVERFFAGVHGKEEWDRDMLLRRATALSSRQRAGKGAPPSPSILRHGRLAAEDVVPVFTPPAPRLFVPPSDVSSFKKFPSSLLAPRYAHLHEEVAVNTGEQPSPSPSSDAEASGQSDEETVPARQHLPQPSTPPPTCDSAHVRNNENAASPPASATKRVLSYLGSFLGRGGRPTTTKPALKPMYPALPLPPPEMRQTVRGPVSTPAKKPIPKSRAPRELVHLAETQLPPKSTALPRAKSAREMVSLNHIDPPRSVQRPRTTSVPIVIPQRKRTDSGGSVKDLVRSFEQVQKRTEEEMARLTGSKGAMMRKVASVGNLKGRAPWKP